MNFLHHRLPLVNARALASRGKGSSYVRSAQPFFLWNSVMNSASALQLSSGTAL